MVSNLSLCFCISNLSFMSVFYSSDMVLEYLSFTQFNFYIYLIFLCICLFYSSLYSSHTML